MSLHRSAEDTRVWQHSRGQDELLIPPSLSKAIRKDETESHKVDRFSPISSRHAAMPQNDAGRDTLYAEFTPLVRRLINRYGQTPELRQELPGEIYCLFCALLKSYDPARGIPLRAYLVRQLNAYVYTFVRRYWNQVKREVAITDEHEDLAQTDPFDPTPDWDSAMEAKGMAAMISKLPRRQRQVVIWRYYEDLSFDEIAERMNVQVSTTRSLLRYGLANLRSSMSASRADDERHTTR